MNRKRTKLGDSREPGASRRGRPTKERAQAIEQAILTTATSRFLADGFELTAMEVVAADARISKGTLYARYSTKKALLRAVVENHIKALSAANRSRDHMLGPSLKERLHHHADSIVSALAMRQQKSFELLVTSSGFAELAESLYENGYRYTVRMLTEEIAKGTSADPRPARHPERVAEMLIAMIVGWYRTEETVRKIPDEEARQYAREAVETIFAGRDGW